MLIDYFLSKRTEMYAQSAYVNNLSSSNVGIRATGVDVATGADLKDVTMGIRHNF